MTKIPVFITEKKKRMETETLGPLCHQMTRNALVTFPQGLLDLA